MNYFELNDRRIVVLNPVLMIIFNCIVNYKLKKQYYDIKIFT